MMRAVFAIICVAAISACTPTDPSVSPSGGQLVTSSSASPGTTLPSADVAAQLMRAVCSAPDPYAVAAANGFVQSRSTGTLFHQTYNLSINAEGRVCSLVFINAGTAAQATAALRSVPATLGRSAPNPLNSRTDIFSATYGV